VKVFVAGGTGAIGGHAIPALVGEGHRVAAIARTPDKATALASRGAEAIVGRLGETDMLRRPATEMAELANHR
jgi:uncharacterized protein YbjT (DUF2867 family)